MFLHFNTEVVIQKHTIECLVLFISSSFSARARVVLNSITIVTIRFLFQISTENCLRSFQTNLLAQIHNFSEQWGIERVAQLNRCLPSAKSSSSLRPEVWTPNQRQAPPQLASFAYFMVVPNSKVSKGESLFH